MSHHNPIGRRLLLFLFTFSVLSVANNQLSAQDGKALFKQRCASCHQLENRGTGPALKGVLDREPYGGDFKKITNWVYNVGKMATSDPYYIALKAEYGSMMQAFTPADLPEKDLEAIIKYVNAPPVEGPVVTPGAEEPASNNSIIFGVVSLILAVIALILMQVNSNLKKMSDDAEGIRRPEPVPFYRNKVYIAMLAIVLFAVGGYYVSMGAIGLGRQKDYQPTQPIFYSHKVHAGLNQINCLYCHGSAWDSKVAGIPAVNICMNCHKAINEYKGPKLYTEEGEEVNGTAEMQKLFVAAGFDPKNPNAWKPEMAKPIEWVKIHNLPDHVYFNHSQHIRAGKVQCQTCHGEITAMDEVKQFSELSMGWCVNCHRQTKVDFNYNDSTGNKFYSIYEKFHNDIKDHKKDSITVADIGGIECQKCHY